MSEIVDEDYVRFRQETENFLREIGVDYWYEGNGMKIGAVDASKVQPITRKLSINEQQIIYGIAELRGVRIPVLDPSSQEFLYKPIVRPEDLSGKYF